MKVQKDVYEESKKEFSKELTQELKRRFKVLESETGVDDDIEMKKQLFYNMLYSIVLDVENELVGDDDVQVIEEAVEDYEHNCIDDIRGKYFNYLYTTDTKLF